ncbi:hypothetical protein [Dokdonella sp.]|uniref:hypothetical protein n=1 Tax=Dokdonella sp. TaxID=2291710 RepID=UPI002F42D79C
MNTLASRFVALLVIVLAASAAHADERLWYNEIDTWSTTRDSIVVTGPGAAFDQEVADDFEATGLVRRVVAYGHDCFNCAGAFSTGVRVRVYARQADGSPGAELYGFRLDADDPRFLHDLNQTGHEETVDVTFPQPFVADGGYFISVQLEYAAPAYWPIWSSHHTAPRGSPAYLRDNAAGGAWAPHSDALGPSHFDFAFALYGTPPGPPAPTLVAGCGEWNVEPLPLPDGATAVSVHAVQSFGNGEEWLVGGYDTGTISALQTFSLAYHRTAADPAWRIVPTPSPEVCSPNPGCAKVWFNAIDGVASDDVWAAGWKDGRSDDFYFGGQLFLAHWDGEAWTEVAAPPTHAGAGAEVAAIKALATDDVWFVGSWVSGGQWPALALHWNGVSLEQVATPFPLPGTPGWSLAAIDGSPGDLWAVGAGSDGDMSTSPYILRGDGSTWELAGAVPMPGQQVEFNAVLALANDDVYAAGSWFTGGTGYGPLVVHWDGTQWTTATQAGGGGPMARIASGLLALGNPTLFHDGVEWRAQPGLADFDSYAWADLQATGACNALGAAIVDVAGVRRSVAVRLRPRIFFGGFD